MCSFFTWPDLAWVCGREGKIMHGMINRSIQCFLRDTYGAELWAQVAEDAGVSVRGFEALLRYDDAVSETVLAAVSHRLDKPREAVLEDLGIYLAHLEPLRRLLRFGGVDYPDFLQSLDELPSRARLAVPDLEMPELAILSLGGGRFRLECRHERAGFGAVFAGVLRAMADDYGALALIDATASDAACDTVSIELLEVQYAVGRGFDLAERRGL